MQKKCVDTFATYEAITSACQTASNTTPYSFDYSPCPSIKTVKLADGTTVPSPYCTKISTFLCPSDPAGREGGDTELARNSYRVNRGDALCTVTVVNTADGRGPFICGDNKTPVNFSSIIDGTSNTLLGSESGISQNDDDRQIISGLYANVGVNPIGSNYTGGKPAICAALRGNGGYFVDPTAWGHKGNRWGDGRVVYSGFFTILPPNSPSCQDLGDDGHDISGNQHPYQLVSASSYHRGGVNVCFLDGAVRFISETIDAGDPNLLPGENDPRGTAIGDGKYNFGYGGPSCYGVWGALGSYFGKEQVSSF
ncbi:MAG: DUF1559 domain-containing protein [Planctomycetaceae bacterium]|nr:DUF1559 domain-containing protein [Planctomycetaceae bacterium]